MPICYGALQIVLLLLLLIIIIHGDFSPERVPVVSSLGDSAERKTIVCSQWMFVWVVVVQGHGGEDRLFKELFKTRHYNKYTCPVANLSETTYVQLGIVLLKIVQVVCVSYKKLASTLSVYLSYSLKRQLTISRIICNEHWAGVVRLQLWNWQ